MMFVKVGENTLGYNLQFMTARCSFVVPSARMGTMELIGGIDLG
jgi:hypothetical protein